jgi:sterol desaturase/sphingolipid hydroxylase (fatty acid hydroxylase superfamily)
MIIRQWHCPGPPGQRLAKPNCGVTGDNAKNRPDRRGSIIPAQRRLATWISQKSQPDGQKMPKPFPCGKIALFCIIITAPESGFLELLDLYARLLDPQLTGVIAFTVLAIVAAALLLGRRDLLSRSALDNSRVSLLFFISNFLLLPTVVLFKMSLVAGYSALGLPQLPTAIWASVPFALLVVIVFLADELWLYWVHRWLHSRWGWPIHAIHHSDTHVNGLTLWRIHVLEAVSMRFFAVLMISWMGLPPEAAGASTVFALLHAVYIHSPLDWDHGPLRMVIASPRFHRWHHYDAEPAYTTNLANAVPLFDWLFGTYRAPHRLDAPLGARTANVPDTDFIALWLWPFREWSRMVRKQPAADGESTGMEPGT